MNSNACYEPYPEYKASGIDWLGGVPAHWDMWRLKNWVSVNEEVLPETTDPSYEFNYIEIGAVSSGRLLGEPTKIRFANAPSRARRVVRAGDTIISTVRTYLKAVWFAGEGEDDLICSTGFAVLTPRNGTSPKFVSYLAQSDFFTERVTAESIGTAYPAIAEGKLSSFRIPIPPLDEQTAIVRYLDHADERINRAISAKERLIELLTEQHQATIHQAVTRGLDPNVRLKDSGAEWLGDVPEHWEVRRLKSVGSIRYGLGQPPREALNGLPLIRATNVERGRITDNDMLYVDPEDVPKGRDAILTAGEIIVVRSGAYTADSAIVPNCYDGAVTGYDMVVTAMASIRPEFLAFTLLSTYLRDHQLIVASTRSAQPHLNAEELGTSILLLPPVAEQAAIVRHLDKATVAIDTAIDTTQRQIDLLREYRTRLIADVVTGQVDVRGAVGGEDELPVS